MTSRLERSGVVQRKDAPRIAAPGPVERSSAEDWSRDPYLDAALRGSPPVVQASGELGGPQGVQLAARVPAARVIVQRTSINDDYSDPSEPEYDPGHLSDSDIKGTTEYETLVKDYCHPPFDYTENDAVLACKLALRLLREGGEVDVTLHGLQLMARAHQQAASTASAERLENKLEWVQIDSDLAVNNPSQLDSEFARWLLVVGQGKPSDTTGKMNCWEFVMFAAYQAGVIKESHLKQLYAQAVENAKKKNLSVGQTFEEVTKASPPITFQLGDPYSPKPLRGDIVVFKSLYHSGPAHVCIATGKVVQNHTTGKDEHEVVSLWSLNGKKVEKTTIEQLDPFAQARPILFWSAKWDAI